MITDRIHLLYLTILPYLSSLKRPKKQFYSTSESRTDVPRIQFSRVSAQLLINFYSTEPSFTEACNCFFPNSIISFSSKYYLSLAYICQRLLSSKDNCGDQGGQHGARLPPSYTKYVV